MIINKKFKPIMELVSLLTPNYVFSPRPCVGASNKAHYIDIHWVPELSSEYWVYVGFLCLESIHIKSIKPTETILAIPSQNTYAKKMIKDWRSIGIHCKGSKFNSNGFYYHYYSIRINDADNTKETVN